MTGNSPQGSDGSYSKMTIHTCNSHLTRQNTLAISIESLVEHTQKIKGPDQRVYPCSAFVVIQY